MIIRIRDTLIFELDWITLLHQLLHPGQGSGQGFDWNLGLFGDRFQPRDGLLAISLSNLNPQNHMGIALGNMTRMERGEIWSQGQNVTPNIGRLLESLDQERLAIAKVLGLKVRTIFEHFHLSFQSVQFPK